MITIEIAYASNPYPVLIALAVPINSTVIAAIQQSGLLQRYPEIDLTQQAVGIFNHMVALDNTVQAGDRIEIYRPLLIDPKEARRVRANTAVPSSS